MKLGLINSAWAQTGRDTAYGIQKTKEIGFDCIDIFADPLTLSESETQVIIDTTRRAGLPIVSVCCVALGLADFNDSVRAFHLHRCRRYLDLCAALGASNLLLVVGEYVWQQEVIPPAVQWQSAVDAVRELGAHGAQLGVNIALELEPFDLSLINTVDTMLRFVTDVGMPSVVRANVDISHLDLQHVPVAEVARLKGLIEHVHLSDCDGQVHGDLPPGRGVTPITDYLRAVRDTGFDGTVSIELEYSPDPDQIEAWVQEAYEQTDQIMRALDCRD
ncbi:MAG: sugar phosphate isomerase/epimerase [Fimbriimonadaceae bacterium]|nr:sugar phosphate isomerase/epimerase [Fimbriimonadaceae bacterium]